MLGNNSELFFTWVFYKEISTAKLDANNLDYPWLSPKIPNVRIHITK